MEPIADLDELKRIVDALKQRELVVELSPPGRGQMLSHNLYPEWELEAVRKSVAAGLASSTSDEDADSAPASRNTPSSHLQGELEQLRAALETLSARVQKIESELGL